MFLETTAILAPKLDADERIREDTTLHDAVIPMMRSIQRFGQMMPVLVEKLEEPIDGKEWRLIDGMTRYVAINGLWFRAANGEENLRTELKGHGMEFGMIEVKTRETLDPLMRLMMEFHANDDRTDFSYQEKGRYIRNIHDALTKEHAGSDKPWTALRTAEYTRQSEATVSHYLQLTDPESIAAQSKRVQSARTKGAAMKQLKIEKERILRTAQVKSATRAKPKKEKSKKKEKGEEEKEVQKSGPISHIEAAQNTIYHGDCRDWIKGIPGNSLSWFHWDPPYGGQEGVGGAFPSHEPVQTDTEYCLTLVEEMVPEIYRVLYDGAWVAIWFTPSHYNRIKFALQGHVFNSLGDCNYCKKNIYRDYYWITANYSCRPSPHRFWVNPYPNVWQKVGFNADGHEIQRFFTKQTEYFLLAGKNRERMPILMNSGRGNIFAYPPVERGLRRHVNHKPPALIEAILSSISVPGSLGGDAGAGSGSSIEAAYNSGRKIIAAEINEGHYLDCLSLAADAIKVRNYETSDIIYWEPL